MQEKETDIQNERKGREKRKTEREMNRQQNGKLLKMETYQSKYTYFYSSDCLQTQIGKLGDNRGKEMGKLKTESR